MPPAARASGPGPGRSGMPAAVLGLPAAHRRQPDHVRLVQVVRPAGRSTWTRRTWPGRALPARREALTHRSLHAILGGSWGVDLATTAFHNLHRPTRTNALTSTYSQIS